MNSEAGKGDTYRKVDRKKWDKGWEGYKKGKRKGKQCQSAKNVGTGNLS